MMTKMQRGGTNLLNNLNNAEAGAVVNIQRFFIKQKSANIRYPSSTHNILLITI